MGFLRLDCDDWGWIYSQVVAHLAPAIRQILATNECHHRFYACRRSAQSFLQMVRRSAQFQANLNYSFSVGGTAYTGQYSRMFHTEAEALEFIRDLGGKTLTAQVNPAKPTKSLVFDSAIQNLIRARPSRTFEQMNYQNPDAHSLLVHSVFTVVRYPRGRWISPEHVGPRWRHSWTRRRAINILCGLPGGNLRGLFSSGPGSHQDRGNFPPQ